MRQRIRKPVAQKIQIHAAVTLNDKYMSFIILLNLHGNLILLFTEIIEYNKTIFPFILY